VYVNIARCCELNVCSSLLTVTSFIFFSLLLCFGVNNTKNIQPRENNLLQISSKEGIWSDLGLRVNIVKVNIKSGTVLFHPDVIVWSLPLITICSYFAFDSFSSY